MQRYEHSTPRSVLGLASIALAVLTIGLAIVLPSKMQSASPETASSLATRTIDAKPIEVAIIPASIEVVEISEPKNDFQPVGYVRPAREERS